jgi:hypothetical protein
MHLRSASHYPPRGIPCPFPWWPLCLCLCLCCAAAPAARQRMQGQGPTGAEPRCHRREGGARARAKRSTKGVCVFALCPRGLCVPRARLRQRTAEPGGQRNESRGGADNAGAHTQGARVHGY